MQSIDFSLTLRTVLSLMEILFMGESFDKLSALIYRNLNDLVRQKIFETLKGFVIRSAR